MSFSNLIVLLFFFLYSAISNNLYGRYYIIYLYYSNKINNEHYHLKITIYYSEIYLIIN